LRRCAVGRAQRAANDAIFLIFKRSSEVVPKDNALSRVCRLTFEHAARDRSWRIVGQLRAPEMPPSERADWMRRRGEPEPLRQVERTLRSLDTNPYREEKMERLKPASGFVLAVAGAISL